MAYGAWQGWRYLTARTRPWWCGPGWPTGRPVCSKCTRWAMSSPHPGCCRPKSGPVRQPRLPNSAKAHAKRLRPAAEGAVPGRSSLRRGQRGSASFAERKLRICVRCSSAADCYILPGSTQRSCNLLRCRTRPSSILKAELVSARATTDLAYEVEIHRLLTSTYRREDDGWRIVHRHADPIPASGRSSRSRSLSPVTANGDRACILVTARRRFRPLARFRPRQSPGPGPEGFSRLPKPRGARRPPGQPRSSPPGCPRR